MKKIFYNKRRRLPIWSQIYIVWILIFLAAIFWITKFGIIHNNDLPRKNFNYKKNQNIVTQSYNEVINKIDFIKDYSDKEILKLNSMLGYYNWKVDKLKAKQNNTDCTIIKYAPENQKIEFVILFENSNGSVSKIIYTFARSLMKSNIFNVGLAAINGNPVCNDYAVEQNIFPGIPSRYMVVYPANLKRSGIQTSFLYGQSSISWSAVIPEAEERPGILEQLGHLTIPYFQRTFVEKTRLNLNLIGWYFHKKVYDNELDNVNFILPGLLFVAQNFSSVKQYDNYIWLGKDTAITQKGINALAFVLVLLIWLPIANRLYQKESIGSLFRAIFSALFSSFLVIILLGATRIFTYFIPESIFGPLIVIALGIFLVILSNKMHANTLNIQVNSLTEFLVLIIFSSGLGFCNFSIFAFLLPVIFLTNIKSELSPVLFKLLFFILISPLFYFLFLFGKQFGFSPSISLAIMDKVFYSHLYQTFFVILFAGSLIAIARDPS